MIHASRLAAIALFATFPVFAVAPKDRTLHLTHAWNLSLGADGRVTALDDKGELVAVVREPLESAIRGWTFDPGHVGGHPAPTETTLTVDVSFRLSKGGAYVIRVDDARTGGSIAPRAGDKNAFPRLTGEAVRKRLTAMVVVKASYDQDGNVVSVEPQPTQSISSSRALDAITTAAVKHWVVRPERAGGHGIASSVMVPFCYTIGVNRADIDIDCTWKPSGSTSAVGNGGAFAMEPAVHLRSDVIGHAL